MASNKVNSNDEKGFFVTETYLSDGKAFGQLMKEIISRTINSKNKDFSIELQHAASSYHSK